MKICTKCDIEKEESDFYPVKLNGEFVRYTAACKKCTNAITSARNKLPKGRNLNKEAVQRYRQKPKGKITSKNAELLRSYGITLDEYLQMMVDRDGKCDICGTDQANSVRKDLYVDHCHATLKVRGLLCQSCNMALGLFKDDTQRLLTAADYLKRSQE